MEILAIAGIWGGLFGLPLVFAVAMYRKGVRK